MPGSQEDKVREDRITMEIIVDAYSLEEQAMGWYYYLADSLSPMLLNARRSKYLQAGAYQM